MAFANKLKMIDWLLIVHKKPQLVFRYKKFLYFQLPKVLLIPWKILVQFCLLSNFYCNITFWF